MYTTVNCGKNIACIYIFGAAVAASFSFWKNGINNSYHLTSSDKKRDEKKRIEKQAKKNTVFAIDCM